MYPINLSYEIPLNKNDYLRINLDFSINRNDVPKKEEIKKVLENAFEEIKNAYRIT